MGEFKGEDRLLIINQKGIVKTIKPELTTHFDSDMIVLEKWIPEKPISVIYFDGDKEKYFLKRFMIDNPNKEEIFISEHPKSELEIVSTDYRPMAEVVFSKRSLEVLPVNFEDFIAIKGIKALGNQLTIDKIKQVNLLNPLPYEPPVIEEVEVNDEEVIDNGVVEETISKDEKTDINSKSKSDDEGQITLF